MRVLDGDTVELSGGERLRLMAIDAPETGQPTRLRGLDAGALARQCLQRLLARGEWRLVQEGRDRYGRLLGDLRRGELSAAQWLLEQGCASHYPLVRTPRWARAREAAQRARRGLWAEGGFERPYRFRKNKGPRKWAFAGGGAKKLTQKARRRPVATE